MADFRWILELLDVPVARRDFLVSVGASLLVASCKDDETGGAVTDTGGVPADGSDVPEVNGLGDLPYAVWQELREVVRQSPDHLSSRAQRLVAAGDPEAIYRFVRDEIRVIPVEVGRSQPDADRRVRWGVRGTLRAGAGTPREKADLLADLLEQAGFASSVLSGPPDLDDEEIDAAFLDHPLAEFAPPFDSTRVAQWRSALGIEGPPAEARFADAAGADSQALADRLLEVVPEDWADQAATVALQLERMPVVRAEIEGEQRFANPWHRAGELGASYLRGEPAPAGEAIALASVSVSLSAATTDDPQSPFPLVEGSWTADEVVGRQLVVQLTPPLSLQGLASTRLSNARTFVATLAVEGPDLDAEASAALRRVGEMITLEGDRVAHDADTGALSVDGRPLAGAESGAGPADQVVSLAVRVHSARFPNVELRVSALDSAGDPVAGLGAPAFALAGDGVGTGFVLRANTPDPPRVLLVFDTSDSIPEAFRDDGAADLAREVASRVLADNPAAELRAATVFDGRIQASGSWTSDGERLASDVTALEGFGSDLWQAVAGAAELEASVVVLITDGQATDAATAELAAAIRVGPVVVGIHVTDDQSGRETLESISSLGAGAVFPVTDVDGAASAITAFVRVLGEHFYTLSTVAPLEGPAERTATVSVAEVGVEGEARYEVPPETERTAPRRWIGLYLTVRVGEDEVTRTLAGFDPTAAVTPSEDDAHRVTDAAFGVWVLSIEGGAPTLAAWVDDLIANKLRLRPLLEANTAGDDAALVAALESGPYGFPPGTIGLNAPVPAPSTADASTFEVGLRVSLFGLLPDFDAGEARRTVDILPLTRFATLATDPSSSLARTLRQSARLAVLESAHFAASTASLLASVELVALARRRPIEEAVPGLDEATAARWNALLEHYRESHRLVPADGSAFTFWAVDPATGSLLGVLPDGSAGGTTVEQLEQAQRDIGLLFWIMGLAGDLIGAAHVHAVAKFLLFIASLYLRAAVVIATLDVTEFDEDLRRMVVSLACSVLLDTVIEGTSYESLGIFLDALDALAGFSVC